MKTEKEFESYYNNTILPQLDKLEEEKERARRVKRNTIIGIVIGIFALNFPFFYSDYIFVSLAITSLIGYFCHLAITYRSSNDYESDFKDEVVRGIIAFLNPDMVYDPDAGINKNAFAISGIYSDRLEDFDSSDLIKGSIGDTNIQFSWCGQFFNSKRAMFNGLFFIGDFNKAFTGEIYVLHRLSVTAISKLVSRAEIIRPPRVTMEDNDFNDAFIVYGTDPVETRYVITPAMMQKMLDLRAKTNENISFSFVRGYVFMAIPFDGNIFDPKIVSQGYAGFLVLFQYLNMALSLVDDFGLNKRIWG